MKKYIEDNRDFLRKQKQDGTKNSYGMLVTDTYEFLEARIEQSNKDYCNPKNVEVSIEVFGNKDMEDRVRSFIKDLRKSEYISVEGTGKDRQIKILKKLDF